MLTQAREPFKTFLYVHNIICVISCNYIARTRASDPHKQCKTQFTRDWTVRRLEWSARSIIIIIIIILRQVFAHMVRSIRIYTYRLYTHYTYTASPTTVAFTFARGHCRRVARTRLLRRVRFYAVRWGRSPKTIGGGRFARPSITLYVS